MSRPMILTPSEHAAHRALEHLVPTFDPPEGDLPDPEELVAFAEGRLAPGDRDRVRASIAASPAARVELRALYPQTYAQTFDATPVEVGAKVLAFRRPMVWGVVLAAAAALFLTVLRPVGAPQNASAGLSRVDDTVVRSAGETYLLSGAAVDLFVDLGQAGVLDRLGGGTPWGALVRVDADEAKVLCTHTDARCRSSATTMASRQIVSGSVNDRIRFVAVLANRPVDLSAIAGPAAEARARIEAAAAAAGGEVRWLPTVVIDRP